MTEYVCEACGEPNPREAAFCVICGAYLGWNEREAATQPSRDEAITEPPPQAGATQPVRPGPAPPSLPSRRVPSPPPAAAPPTSPCPNCGQRNDPGRRFCSRCGHLLAGPAPAAQQQAQPVPRGGWWRRWRDSPERLARREYRRSLPPFYRWRRVLLTLTTIVVVGVLFWILGDDPVGRARQLWYDLRGTTDAVADVTAVSTDGPGRTPADDPRVLDRDPSTYWSRTWVPGSSYSRCEASARDGYVELRWPEPTRVRALTVHAGLAEGVNERDLQFRPATLLVAFVVDGQPGSCLEVDLGDDPEAQRVDLDTGGEVTALQVSVSAVFDSRTPQQSGPVSLRRLVVLARPS